MPLDVRTLQPGETERAFTMVERTFGSAPHPVDVPVELALVDPARFYAGWDDDELVATAGSFDLRMTVPGAQVPVAGVTWVGVLPTHRRRGLLNALMRRQLDDLHDAGCAVAALWASEAAIYGRYGYGPAAWLLGMTLPRGAAFRAPVERGHVRLVEPDAGALSAAYDRVAASTPGFPQRDGTWWRYRLHDPEHARSGASPLQCAVTEGGYALYSTTSTWEAGLPTGVVRVRELVAATPDAHARLWRHVLDLDLMREVQVFAAPTDDPLLADVLAEPRAARAGVRDCLHVRLVDLPAALAGRRYAAEVDVALAVDDPQCPWNSGTWRLVGGRDGATCTRTGDEPDLVAAPSDLGAAYLGGTPLRSRRVVERTPGALSRTTTAFGPLDRAPWCPQVY